MPLALLRLAGVAGVLVLAGCSAPASTDPGADPAIADSRPTTLLDLSCPDLLDGQTVAAAFSADTKPVPLSWYGSGDYFTLAQLGAEQAGALRCEWSDQGGATERYLQVTVLPEATDAWADLAGELAVYQPRAGEFGETSFSSCSTSNGYSSCRIDALIGDRWIGAILGGLSSPDAAVPLMASLAASVQSASAADSSWAGAPSPATSCSELLPLDRLRAALGVEVDEWANPMPTLAVFHGGFQQAGGTICQWRNSFGSASAMTVDAVLLPRGAWAWPGNWATEPHNTVTREPLDGLGDEAYRGCSAKLSGGSDCWVSALVGEDWLAILVNDESSDDERAVAAELVELAIGSLPITKD